MIYFLGELVQCESLSILMNSQRLDSESSNQTTRIVGNPMMTIELFTRIDLEMFVMRNARDLVHQIIALFNP